MNSKLQTIFEEMISGKIAPTINETIYFIQESKLTREEKNWLYSEYLSWLRANKKELPNWLSPKPKRDEYGTVIGGYIGFSLNS